MLPASPNFICHLLQEQYRRDYLSIYLYLYLSIYLPIYLSLSLSILVSISLSLPSDGRDVSVVGREEQVDHLVGLQLCLADAGVQLARREPDVVKVVEVEHLHQILIKGQHVPNYVICLALMSITPMVDCMGVRTLKIKPFISSSCFVLV